MSENTLPLSSSTIEKPPVGLSKSIIDGFERLDKWKGCEIEGEGVPTPEPLPKRLVFEHNRARAAATGFPTRLQVGQYGLTDHEVAAIFGWTTGDY
jgi:hypothetical protein